MATVMIVEDDPSLLLLYRRELEQDGHLVLAVGGGEECLRRMAHDVPDLVVMDIRMPGMDGIETVGRIRDRHRSLPVVLNTAFDSYRNDFRTWIADAYVTKSSDTTELRSAIRRLLASHTGARAV